MTMALSFLTNSGQGHLPLNTDLGRTWSSSRTKQGLLGIEIQNAERGSFWISCQRSALR